MSSCNEQHARHVEKWDAHKHRFPFGKRQISSTACVPWQKLQHTKVYQWKIWEWKSMTIHHTESLCGDIGSLKQSRKISAFHLTLKMKIWTLSLHNWNSVVNNRVFRSHVSYLDGTHYPSRNLFRWTYNCSPFLTVVWNWFQVSVKTGHFMVRDINWATVARCIFDVDCG